MKRKNLVSILLALTLVLSLCGCGASKGTTTGTNKSENAVAETWAADNGFGMPAEAPAAPEYASDESQEVSTDRKLIRRVHMDVETEDLDETMSLLTQRIAAAGGYVENQEQYNGSNYSYDRYRSASLVVRVPVTGLDDFISQVETISNVTTFRQSQEDVTLDYVATESRVQALETEQTRLLELMEQAETMSDLLDIESRLTDVRYELERVTSQLRVMSNQVDYATVNLNIEQVRVYTPVEKQTVWQRISQGFSENLGDIWENLQDLFVWVVVYLPQLLILAAIVVVIVVLCKRSTKKRRKKFEEAQKAYLRAQQQNQNQNPQE